MKEAEATDQYLALLQDISSQILQSRYRAARLVNRELLLLYFAVGKRLSEKVAAEKWGSKVVSQLSTDLQKQLPGLRGFSATNLKNMRQFAEIYSQLGFVQSPTAQNPIGQLTTGQLEEAVIAIFLSVSFTHHVLLLNRCSDWNERWFYMQQTVDGPASVQR